MGAQLSLIATRNECVFSPCPDCGSVPRCGCKAQRVYRYLLKRRLHLASPALLWVLANPSVADDFRLDPTLTRCADYTEQWGFGEMRVVNARAFISSKPKLVPKGSVAIGPDNDNHIIEQAAQAQLVVCGWGALSGGRSAHVLKLIRPYCVPHALSLTKAGEPGHPLYLRKDLKPFPLEAR